LNRARVDEVFESRFPSIKEFRREDSRSALHPVWNCESDVEQADPLKLTVQGRFREVVPSFSDGCRFMRKIGEISKVSHRKRLALFLGSRGIECRIEPQHSAGDIWILDEDRVPEAKRLFAEFLSDPDSSRFDAPPADMPHPPVAIERPRRPQIRMGDSTPLTMTLIGISVAVAITTRFGEQRPELLQRLWLTDAWRTDGEIWRIFTPMFIHLGMMHLFFNMYWLWMLGGTIERLKGTAVLAGLTAAIAAVSHLSQAAIEGGHFGGMSGVVYGLFGYAWMRSSLLPWEGFYIPRDSVLIMIGWLFFCLFGLLGPVANTAHFAGLLMGMLLGAWPRLMPQH